MVRLTDGKVGRTYSVNATEHATTARAIEDARAGVDRTVPMVTSRKGQRWADASANRSATAGAVPIGEECHDVPDGWLEQNR